MSVADIIRAWKDPEYRASLTEEQRAALPPHPAGVVELSEADLDSVAGGRPAGWDSLGSKCWNCTGWGC